MNNNSLLRCDFFKKKQTRIFSNFLLIGLLSFSSGLVYGGVHQCTGRNGTPVFTDSPVQLEGCQLLMPSKEISEQPEKELDHNRSNPVFTHSAGKPEYPNDFPSSEKNQEQYFPPNMDTELAANNHPKPFPAFPEDSVPPDILKLMEEENLPEDIFPFGRVADDGPWQSHSNELEGGPPTLPMDQSFD